MITLLSFLFLENLMSGKSFIISFSYDSRNGNYFDGLLLNMLNIPQKINKTNKNLDTQDIRRKMSVSA